MPAKKQPRDDYWGERFERAKTDPDEARALLREFSVLADDAVGADPLLVQWVALRVKAWADTGFVRDEASGCFGTKKAPHAPKSDRSAEKRAQALADVHRLNRLEGVPLEDAFAAAGKNVSLSAKQVRDDYEAFRVSWREGGGDVGDWLPVLLRLPKADRKRALENGRIGRPLKKASA